MPLTKEQADMALGIITGAAAVLIIIIVVLARWYIKYRHINNVSDYLDRDEYLDNKTRHEIED